MFADVCGSTELYERLGDEAATAAIEARLGPCAETVTAHGGRVMKTLGDGLLCFFPEAPIMAFLTGARMQKNRNLLPMRVGIHHGSMVHRGGDIFGDVVNTAARLSAVADRRQVVASMAAIRAAFPFPYVVRRLGEVALPGKAAPVHCAEVLRSRHVQAAPAAPRDGARGGGLLSFRIGDGGGGLFAPPFTIGLGRGPGNELRVAAQDASSRHARLEHDGGALTLTDFSTNGTWVMQGRAGFVHVHRREIALQPQVPLLLGIGSTDDPSALVTVGEPAALDLLRRE